MLTRRGLVFTMGTAGLLLWAAVGAGAVAPEPAKGGPNVPPANAQKAIGSPGLIFCDRFEYEVKRDELDPRPAFITEGKWSWVKSENTGAKGAHGYLYTVDRIPGHKGEFPGKESKRVLAIEACPGTFGFQTDFYLQYGTPNSPADQIPANVWFQFWIHVNYYDDPQDKEDQLSDFRGGMKWIYPSVNGFYPTHPGWLLTLGTSGPVVLKDRAKLFYEKVDSPDLLLTLISENGAWIKKADPWDRWKLGQTSLEEHIVRNRWTLVKLHMDSSTTSGKFEAWMTPLGGKTVKVAEWIDGVTPDFSWKIPAEKVGGYRVFRIPTTLGNFGEKAKEDNKDSWIYLDDFAMAGSEDALPKYPD